MAGTPASNRFRDYLAGGIQAAIEILSLVLVVQGVPPLEAVELKHSTLLHKGRPLYRRAGLTGNWGFRTTKVWH